MKNQTKKTFKIYWENILNYKKSSFGILIAVIGAGVTNSLVPVFYKNFFNNLTGSQPKNILYTNLLFILLTIGILELLRWASWRAVNFLVSFMESHVMADLSNKCFAYLHKHSFSYFNNNFTGSMVKKAKSFVSAFETIIDQFIFNIFPSIINITVITIVLMTVNKILALAVIVWIIIFLSVNWIFTKYKLQYDIKRAAAETNITGILSDTISNSTNIKLFNGYKSELNNFKNANENLRKIRLFTWNLGQYFEAGQGLFMVALEVGIFFFAIQLWRKNIFTAGDFVLIQAYLITIFNYTWDFGRVIRKIYENLADAEEMTEVFNTPHEITDSLDAKELVVEKGKVEFRDVDFYYNNKNKKIIKNLNLIIKPKEKVALIGPSGAGKTTIVKLILRMHNIASGKILIDEQNIAKVTQESLRENISLVPQDPILFHRTLMENIRYGKQEATDEEVIEAAKKAHAHEFISECVDGYNTYVGERGIKLSGGERQRVAIARAILRNAPILILDEATSSLDSESETFIQEALDELMKDKTVIVIAHRLSTIKKADRIIVVDKGGINEQGTHEQLIKKNNGIYKNLWNLQVCGFIK
jgi:ATP-binding cassette, subfamily B, bacterial